MKLALVQFALHVGKRSRNFAKARDMIQQAAEHDPSPDIIILPGVCDVGDQSATMAVLTRAMCQGFAQSMATLAREWGLWIACGHAMIRGVRRETVVSLFDPDGDTFLRFPTMTSDKASSELMPASTPIGTIAAGPMSSILSCNAEVFDAVDLSIVVGDSQSAADCGKIVDRASDFGRYCCIAFPAGADHQASSCVMNRQGEVIASLEPNQTGVAHKELKFPVRSASDITASSNSMTEDC